MMTKIPWKLILGDIGSNSHYNRDKKRLKFTLFSKKIENKMYLFFLKIKLLWMQKKSFISKTFLGGFRLKFAL